MCTFLKSCHTWAGVRESVYFYDTRSLPRWKLFFVWHFSTHANLSKWLQMGKRDLYCILGWVDIGIRTTVRLGKVHFVAKVCKICLKTFLVHWPLPDRCTLLGPCSTYGSKMIFSQCRVYRYQKTQNFT
jgi:hypothetical protein